MDDFHEQLARLALARVGGAGFCLAGGYAVQVHGILDRPSEDIDLFTTAEAAGHFAQAVADVVAAYREAELTVSILDEHAGFARLAVSDARSGAASKVELAIDWRAHPPVILDIGPVLHADDAVANKVNALNSRAQARDYIDVDADVRSGRYSESDLLRLAVEHDPGFQSELFAGALRAVRRLPQAEFTAYGLSTGEATALAARMTEWADRIAGQ